MGDSIAALQRQFTTGRRGRHARHETMKRAISALAAYVYPHDTAQEERRQASAFLLLCTIGGLAIFSSTIAKNPVLPLLTQELGAHEGTIGWVAAASTLTGILASLATAVLGPVAMAYVADLAPTHRGARLGWYASTTLAGRALAPVAGGALLALGPWPWVYALCGIAGGLAFLGMWLLPSPQA